jgi:hypothetical protein
MRVPDSATRIARICFAGTEKRNAQPPQKVESEADVLAAIPQIAAQRNTGAHRVSPPRFGCCCGAGLVGIHAGKEGYPRALSVTLLSLPFYRSASP